MENKISFTKANIEALDLPAAGQRVTYHDTKTAGLQLRVLRPDQALIRLVELAPAHAVAVDRPGDFAQVVSGHHDIGVGRLFPQPQLTDPSRDLACAVADRHLPRSQRVGEDGQAVEPDLETLNRELPMTQIERMIREVNDQKLFPVDICWLEIKGPNGETWVGGPQSRVKLGAPVWLRLCTFASLR